MSELVMHGRPTTLQDYERLLPPQAEIFGGPGFFPMDVAGRLIGLCDSNQVRKTTYHWPYAQHMDAGMPEPLVEAILWGQSLHQPANTAVLKRYSLEDVEPSGAYNLHADPEIYRTQRIALISLSGHAQLTVKLRSGDLVEFDCQPGTALFLAPDLLHAITPPLNSDGLRHFLFLGFDETLDSSG